MSTSAQEAEFVVTRKRKRQTAIDPCLGFYTAPTTVSASLLSVLEHPDLEDAATATTHLSGWTVSPNSNETTHVTSPHSPLSPDSDPLTVEAFLKSNTRRIHVQKYGRKYRNRRVVESNSSPSPSGSDCVDQLDNDDRPRSSKIMGRLLDGPEHCGPTRSAAKLAREHSRPALRFVPVTRMSDKPGHVKPKPRPIRSWTAINAKKGVPFRTSSFSEQARKEAVAPSGLTKQRPLNSWSTFETSKKEPLNKRSKITVNRKRSTRCAPLLFVPLAEAEESYKKKFHAARTNKRGATPSRQDPRASSVAPLVLVSSTNISADTPSNQLKHCPSSPAASFPCALTSILPGVRPPSDPSLQAPGPSPQTGTPIIDPLVQDPDFVAHSLEFVPCTSPASDSATSSSKSSSIKRLKPLGSFLDGFMERVRTATQNEAAAATPRSIGGSILDFAGTDGYDSSPIGQSAAHPDPGLGDFARSNPRAENNIRTRSTTLRAGRARRLRDPAFLVNRAEYEEHGRPVQALDRREMSPDLLEDIGPTVQPEFPPYVPPATPFDINAALLLYTQGANSGIPLCSTGPPASRAAA
ncbi:hypothetical protein DXG01_002219 [Tephrocybe rancida]|nr:hypothetical protein DXG01_002219 [Tephrocybe rancida]